MSTNLTNFRTSVSAKTQITLKKATWKVEFGIFLQEQKDVEKPGCCLPKEDLKIKQSFNLEKIHQNINSLFCILRVVKFRRTGESSRSDEDVISGEHEIQIEGVRTELEPVELEDGAAVPKEFANPTDGE